MTRTGALHPHRQFSEQVQRLPTQPTRLDNTLAAHSQYPISGLILGSKPSNFNQVLGFYVDGPRRERSMSIRR
ncbi:MAG: hypothetical protein PBU96_12185 [Stenotrophomonas geniculata]